MRRYFYILKVSNADTETLRGANVKAQDCILFTRDAGVLCFYLQEYDLETEAFVPFEVPATATLKFGIKQPKDRQADFLAFSDNDQWNEAAHWADVDITTGQVCVRVSCNTVEMLALFATADTHKDFVAEIQMFEQGETEPTTLGQWPVRVVQDIIQGDEGVPESATPEYLNLVLRDEAVAADFLALPAEPYAGQQVLLESLRWTVVWSAVSGAWLNAMGVVVTAADEL